MYSNLLQILKILTLIDLTSLNENDSEISIDLLCQKAATPNHPVAAVCVYPQFVSYVKKKIPQNIAIATVANFPDGNQILENVLVSIQDAIQQGAQEIDVVFPYQKYLQGEVNEARNFIQQCKLICGKNILLKVILETGAFPNSDTIADASREVLLAGADFLKTSTGKIAVGATLEAARVMLIEIKKLSLLLDKPFGLKISGGIKTISQAKDYLQLADEIMGVGWVSPRTFRFGASQLWDEVMKHKKKLGIT